ncbi:MAG TPA: phosphatase PAP2 family protein [Frankiaceae bacterium]|nr:phosphatase PAP2 family protein [Frankiaceae bacterium]
MAATQQPVPAAPVTPAPQRRRGPFPLFHRERRPPRWWQELAFIGISYGVYGALRNHFGNPEPVDCGAPVLTEFQGLACDRARDLLAVERALKIDVEHALNRIAVGTEWFAVLSNYFYALAHFVVTIGVLVWLYKRHPLQYRPMRTALYVTNTIALLGYWLYALAPPRFLPDEGYVDTVRVFGTWGSYASGDLSHASNQFAAMPSMHIGWALWSGLAVFWLTRRTWLRWAGIGYPIVVLVVIMATANHFILDAVGGALALALGFGAQRLLSGEPAVDQAVAQPPLTTTALTTPA